VTASPELPLARGRQELRAAGVLLEAGFPEQAVSRAYLAGLHAATAALAVLGEQPATEVGAICAFGRHVVGRNGVDHETGRILRRLYEDRHEVDLGLAEAPADEARAAVEDARRLVETAAVWIGERWGRRGAA
jgi:uncharacterized protein (UPF0332 family)